MASCGGYFSQHNPSLYGDDFCVECTLQALETGHGEILAPLLDKVCKHSISTTCASRIIIALLEIAKPLTFQMQHIPTIVKALEAVLKKLPLEDSSDASCALLSQCLNITGQERGPQMELALSVLSECLLSNKERIETFHMSQPGKLLEILCCGKVTKELRMTVLKFIQGKSNNRLLVLNKFIAFLLTERSIESKSAILESIGYLLYLLPNDMSVTELLISNETNIFSALTSCLGHSSDPYLQSCASLVILGVLSRNSDKVASQLMKSDLCDAISDVVLSKNHQAVKTLLCSIVQLSTHEEFHLLHWSRLFVRSIILHLSVLDAIETIVHSACLHTLMLIFYHSLKFRKDSVGNNFEAILRVLKVNLVAENEELHKMAQLASIQFLAAKQLSTMEWADEILPFAKLVVAKSKNQSETTEEMEVDEMEVKEEINKEVEENEEVEESQEMEEKNIVKKAFKDCKCFEFEVAKYLIHWCSAPGEDSKENVAMQEWILKSVIMHTEECVLINGSSNPWTYCNLMKVVDSILQAEKLAHIKISLASHLATLNFVGYAFFLPKQGRGYGRCYEVVFQIVNLLCSELLETNLDFASFKETAQLIFNGTEKSKIFEDSAKVEVLLCLFYLDSLYYDYFRKDLEQYLYYIEDYMNKNVQEISSPATKAVIFLYACGKLSGPIPQVVFQLINRWAAIPCKIFTDHVEFVNWMLKIPEGHVCQEVKPAMLALWLSNNLDEIDVACTPQNFHAFLTVVVDNPDSMVARAAHDAIRDSILENSNDKDQLVNLMWQNLPLYLMRASGQNADGHFGHAFLLSLAVKYRPEHHNSIPVEALCSLLPEFLMRHGDFSVAKQWSLAILEAGFSILEHLIVVINNQTKYAEVQIFLQNKQLLEMVQEFVNIMPINGITFSALCLVTALLASQQKFNVCAQNPVLQMSVNPKIVLAAISCDADHKQCSKNLIVMDFITSVAHSADSKFKPVVKIGLVKKHRIGFATNLYKMLHVLIAKHPGTTLESAAWSCLRTVIEWDLDKWLCHLPWMHTLIWTKNVWLLNADCARQMLLFLHCALNRLHQNHCETWGKSEQSRAKAKGSSEKLSNRTAQILLSVAEYFAFELGCKAELCRVFTVLRAMDYELQPCVSEALSSKLIDLLFAA